MLEVLILGTAAGGGLPQWNCACANCQLAREGALSPRLQSGLAISGNGRDWHLINASPDIGLQLERYLRPRATLSGPRSNPVGRIFLTNADLDHTLGLFQLREGGSLSLGAPSKVRSSIEEGLQLDRVVGAYAQVQWQGASRDWQTVDESGLEVRCVPLSGGGPPRYDSGAGEGLHAVGYLFRNGGETVGIFPDVAILDEALLEELAGCTRVWFDGTFWDEEELVRLGFSTRRAADMGHVPISGESGSLAALSELGPGRVSYLHINNTNPILRPDSPERRAVEEAGLQVAEDGGHFII
ncbi:MAG TPA: MBL fold metallo-hydrolase [Chthoniobacterales bacterium]|nr:MBL fold metallo-hydrolase [Chthoniobacterales bacterium]